MLSYVHRVAANCIMQDFHIGREGMPHPLSCASWNSPKFKVHNKLGTDRFVYNPTRLSEVLAIMNDG